MKEEDSSGETKPLVTIKLIDPVVTVPKAIKEILLLTASTLPLQIVTAALPLSSSILLSRYSVVTRKSAVLIQTLINFVTNVTNSPLSLLNTYVGNCNNEKDKEKVSEIMQSGVVFSLLLSLPQIVTLLFSKQLSVLDNQDNLISNTVRGFFNFYVISVPLNSALASLNQISFGLKKPYIALLSQTGGTVAFLSLVYILIHGLGKLEPLGVRGPAISYIANSTIAFLTGALLFRLLSREKGSLRKYKLFKQLLSIRSLGAYLKSMFMNGWKVLLITASVSGIQALTNFLVGSDPDQLAAQLVITQYQNILLLGTIAIGSTAQILISNSVDNPKSGRRYGYLSLMLSWVIPLIYTGFGLVSPKTLMSVFFDPYVQANKGPVNILTRNNLFQVSGANTLLGATSYVSTLSLYGMREFNFKVLLNMLTMWIGVAIGVMLTYVFGFDGSLGFNLGLAIGLLISALGQTGNWLYTASKKIKTSEQALLTETRGEEEILENKDEAPSFLSNPMSYLLNKFGICCSKSKVDTESQTIFTEDVGTEDPTLILN